MARTIWNAADRESILGRFERLSPDARPRWGKFDAPRMVTHVTDAVRASIGEVALTPKASPLRYWPVNVLVMFYLPWPKSAPTAPELLHRRPAGWTRSWLRRGCRCRRWSGPRHAARTSRRAR